VGLIENTLLKRSDSRRVQGVAIRRVHTIQ